jgi:pumilio family protein 6
LLHREASSVLADAFELYANAYERTILLRDFYGKETTLFSVTTGSDEDKERAKKGLRGVLEGLEGEKRKRVMGAVRENLVTMWVFVSFGDLGSFNRLFNTNRFNNPDKGAVTHAIVHRALWEYLLAVNDTPDEIEREKQRREMFERFVSIFTFSFFLSDPNIVVIVVRMSWLRWYIPKMGAESSASLLHKDQQR